MNKSKQLGTAAETAVVRYLHTAGWPGAERRSLRGHHDAGDITGTPGICWEVKGGTAARTASDLTIERWMEELTRERENARADVGLLVVQRAGVGPANAGRWWAVMPLSTVALLRVGIQPPANRLVAADCPVRMLLADATTLLRAAGYGTATRPTGTHPQPDDPGHCGNELHGADGGRCPGCGWDSHPIPATPPAGAFADPHTYPIATTATTGGLL